MTRTLLVFLSLLFFILGCDRDKAGNDSKVLFRAPQKLLTSKSDKVRGLEDIPTGRKRCWGINITGPGIQKNDANQCRPETGLIAGFIPDGQSVEVVAPKGLGRRIAIYLYLQPIGEDQPCPQMGSNVAPKLDSVYQVGLVDNLTFVKDIEDIYIDINFPGLTQSLATQIAAPSSCLPPSSNLNFRVSAGYGISNGGAIRLYGRVGRNINSPVLSGPGINLEVKK